MTTREWKIIGVAAVLVLVAAAAGWVWGAAGGRQAVREMAALRLQHDLMDARSRILAARVDLYRLNFGSAATNLEDAKKPLESAAQALDDRGESERAAAARRAIEAAEEARRLAAQVDQAAQGAAERALAEIQRAH